MPSTSAQTGGMASWARRQAREDNAGVVSWFPPERMSPKRLFANICGSFPIGKRPLSVLDS